MRSPRSPPASNPIWFGSSPPGSAPESSGPGGSETSLAQALKHHELDLAIGGFDAKSPWKSIAGVSQPFAETSDKKKHVFLTVPGENRFILTLDTFLTDYERSSKGNSS